jgi:diketogulonate reductase-like aldo/keto reductase
MRSDATQTQSSRTLADGNEIPLLGLGVWQVPDGRECVDAVRWALELGYRHIDTAQAYGNEESVGRALRESAVPRSEVFLTTKFHPRRQADPAVELEASLRRLGIDQVDLYIIHWPEGGPTWAWPGMEQAHTRGLARSIGISNFSASELAQLDHASTIKPVINQVELNPFCYRRRLIEACEHHDIAVEAYSPLGTGLHLNDPTVKRVAESDGATPAQVLVRWAVQRRIPVLTKSTHRERIASNFQVYGFELSDRDMSSLDALDETGGTDQARETKWW